MVLSDFYSLKIRQEIYYKGEKVGIASLDENGKQWIVFKDSCGYLFPAIMSDLSFDAPKPKREWTVYRYWYHWKDVPELDNSNWTYHKTWKEWHKAFYGTEGDRVLVKTESKIIEGD